MKKQKIEKAFCQTVLLLTMGWFLVSITGCSSSEETKFSSLNYVKIKERVQFRGAVFYHQVDENIWLESHYKKSSIKHKGQILKNGEILEDYEKSPEDISIYEKDFRILNIKKFYLHLHPEKNQVTYVEKENEENSFIVPASFSKEAFIIKNEDLQSIFRMNKDDMQEYIIRANYHTLLEVIKIFNVYPDQIEDQSMDMKMDISDMICSLKERVCRIDQLNKNILFNFSWHKHRN